LGSAQAPPDSLAAVGSAYFYIEGENRRKGGKGKDDLHPTLFLGPACGRPA